MKEKGELSILIKIISIYLIAASIFVYYGMRFLLGKDVITYIDKEKPKTSKAIGVISLVLALLFLKPLATDLVFDTKDEKVVTIESIERASKLNFLYHDVYTNNGTLTVWFDEFYLQEGKSYQVTYYEKTGIILSVEEL